MLTEYFDCLRCAAVTKVTTCPPKCAVCGSGTGVLAKSPGGAVRERDTKTLPPSAGRPDARNLLEALQQYARSPGAGASPAPGNQDKRA